MIGGPLSGFLAMMSGFLVIAGLVSAFTHALPRMVPIGSSWMAPAPSPDGHQSVLVLLCAIAGGCVSGLYCQRKPARRCAGCCDAGAGRHGRAAQARRKASTPVSHAAPGRHTDRSGCGGTQPGGGAGTVVIRGCAGSQMATIPGAAPSSTLVRRLQIRLLDLEAQPKADRDQLRARGHRCHTQPVR